jgi:hypothetical protein
MATYKWRIPVVQAVQFNGENHDEVKELIGDESEGEEFLVGTGEYEEPKEEKPKKEPKEKPKAPEHKPGEHKPGEPHKPADKPADKLGPPEEEPVEVNPDGVGAVPYDPKAKPAPGPVEKTEPLKVAEGDWVVKDTVTGKVEVNPEGFPDKYEFISA